MDTARVKELREKIERARTAAGVAIDQLRQDRPRQLEQVRKSGADQESLDAINREYDAFEQRVDAECQERTKLWQKELDTLLKPGGE